MGLFSSSKKTDASGRVRPPDEEIVRRADLVTAPAGAGWQVVGARGLERTSVWPAYAYDFLGSCEEFKTLGEHLQEYGGFHSLDGAQVREMQHFANEMIEAGLLISARSLAERVVKSGVAGKPARIEGVGIPTAGNAERLRRVITSFARNAREHGRAPEFAVSLNGPADCARLVREISGSEEVKIELLDDRRRAGYADELAKRAGVERSIVEFALGDPLGAKFACGANRNAMLLWHAGRPYLSLDDDVACEMAAAPEREDGLAVFASRDGFERWFYPEYGRALEDGGDYKGDYLALHEKMLGRSVSELMRGAGEVDFVSISDALLRRLQETEGRVVATFTGHYGHPGVPTSYYYLTYQRKTLARLTGEGEEQYRAYLKSGGVKAVVPRMSIADASLSPGMAIGIDARELIPPFPPVLHAEDFVWGASVLQCCAAGFAGHLPVAVKHDPGIGRGIIAPPLEGERPVAVWEFAHLLRGVVRAWQPPPGMNESVERMDGLGRFLCEHAAVSEGNFSEYLRWFVLQQKGDEMDFMEQCLREESDAPEFWRHDLEEYIEQTRFALGEEDFDVPYDMRGKWAPGDARKLMQRMVLEYGRLLRAWPGLMEAAREMKM